MFQSHVQFQREIYLALAGQIKLLSTNGDWAAFLGFLPMGVVFGAAHALTPGHSKAILATYLTGSTERHQQRYCGFAYPLVHSCDDGRCHSSPRIALGLVRLGHGGTGCHRPLNRGSRRCDKLS